MNIMEYISISIPFFTLLVLVALLFQTRRILREQLDISREQRSFLTVLTGQMRVEEDKALFERERTEVMTRQLPDVENSRLQLLKESFTAQEAFLARIQDILKAESSRTQSREEHLLIVLRELSQFQSKIASELSFLSSFKPFILRTIMDPTLFVSGVSAVLQAVQTWIQFRDSKRAAKEFELKYNSSLSDPTIINQANRLITIVPVDVLNQMLSRARKCWEKYNEVLKGQFLPAEVDDATEAVKHCICRELRRIEELNGFIPDGDLRLAAERFCKR